MSDSPTSPVLAVLASAEPLAELPFLVLAMALARDVELTDSEIASAERALNTLDFPELRRAVAETGFTHTEQFEMAWLCDDLTAAIAERSMLLCVRFGDARADSLRHALVALARAVSEASDRPLRGMSSSEERGALVDAVARALAV